MSGALSLKRMPRHSRRNYQHLRDSETLTRFFWAEERGILTRTESTELYALQKIYTLVAYSRRAGVGGVPKPREPAPPRASLAQPEPEETQ